MADQRATLIIKLGDSEIRYEAERQAVEAQLEQLVAPLLRNALPSPLSAEIQAADSPATTPPDAPPATVLPPVAPQPDAPAPTEAELLKRLYEISGGGRLRLRKLPDRAADALLLVLYGMRKLQDRTWVYAPGMTGAARA